VLPYSSEANIFLKLSNPIFSAGDNPADVYIVSIKVFKSFWSIDVSDKSSNDPRWEQSNKLITNCRIWYWMLYYFFRFLNETYFLSNSWQSVNKAVSKLTITHFFAFRLQRNTSWNRRLFWTCFIIYFLIFKVFTGLIVTPHAFSVTVKIVVETCSRPNYAWCICHRTLSNQRSINQSCLLEKKIYTQDENNLIN
jgi:hypothetical protein